MKSVYDLYFAFISKDNIWIDNKFLFHVMIDVISHFTSKDDLNSELIFSTFFNIDKFDSLLDYPNSNLSLKFLNVLLQSSNSFREDMQERISMKF